MTIEARLRRLERAARASDPAILIRRDVLAVRAYLSVPPEGIIDALRAIGPSPLCNHLIAAAEKRGRSPASGRDNPDGLC